MKIQYGLVILFGALGCAHVVAAEYKVETIEEGPPEEVSKEIAAQLACTGVKVIGGNGSTLCDIWLAKQWSVQPGFQPTFEVLYPFRPGHLIGVVRYQRDASDFRDQEIEDGVYTLRYGQQPVDGAHIGTSPTRDFFLLSQVKEDRDPAPLEYDPLVRQSAEAAGTAHPGILCLQPAQASGDEAPGIRHREDRDWWIVSVTGEAKAGDETKKLPVAIIVVGVSPEV